MIEVVSLLIVLVMSLIITRVATVALALTGMSQSAARFQARSALTGAGFTTNESERVVNHPVRRRIILALMLLGNSGLVLGASLMVILLAGGDGGLATRWEAIAALLAGLAALYVAARSAWLERVMARFIERILGRYTDLPRSDSASLLRLGGDYRVVEASVKEGDWLAGRTLSELGLAREGVLVLGITRDDGEYLGAPRGDAQARPGDVLLLYGRHDVLNDLDERRAGIGGELRHAESVARQEAAAGSGQSDPEDRASDGEDAAAEPEPPDGARS